jgi:hypothetical protein
MTYSPTVSLRFLNNAQDVISELDFCPFPI